MPERVTVVGPIRPSVVEVREEEARRQMVKGRRVASERRARARAAGRGLWQRCDHNAAMLKPCCQLRARGMCSVHEFATSCLRHMLRNATLTKCRRRRRRASTMTHARCVCVPCRMTVEELGTRAARMRAPGGRGLLRIGGRTRSTRRLTDGTLARTGAQGSYLKDYLVSRRRCWPRRRCCRSRPGPADWAGA